MYDTIYQCTCSVEAQKASIKITVDTFWQYLTTCT